MKKQEKLLPAHGPPVSPPRPSRAEEISSASFPGCYPSYTPLSPEGAGAVRKQRKTGRM